MKNTALENEIYNSLQDIHISCLDDASFVGAIFTKECVYHYTSLQAALNILKENTLRFTDARFVNDPTELTDAITLFDEVSRSLYSGIVNDPYKLRTLNLHTLRFALLTGFTPKEKRKVMLDNLVIESEKLEMSEIKKSELEEEITTAFVFCTSSNSRSLYQWRAYGDDGSGVALGFKVPQTTSWDLCNGGRYTNASYENNEKKKNYLKNFLAKSLDYLVIRTKSSAGNARHEINHIWFNSMYDLLVIDILACKNEVYFPEEEHRAYYIKHLHKKEFYHDFEFFESRGIIKPVIKKRFSHDYLLEIILGPKCNRLNKASIEMLLKAGKYDQCVVLHCEDMPYR